jgi:hypothetical protein
MKNVVKKIVTLGSGIAFALLTTSMPAHADTTENNKTITKLGVQGTGFYVEFAEPLTQPCVYGIAYFTSTNVYAQMLVAINNGQKLSRVDYVQPGGANTMCNITLVELQPN